MSKTEQEEITTHLKALGENSLPLMASYRVSPLDKIVTYMKIGIIHTKILIVVIFGGRIMNNLAFKKIYTCINTQPIIS